MLHIRQGDEMASWKTDLPEVMPRIPFRAFSECPTIFPEFQRPKGAVYVFKVVVADGQKSGNGALQHPSTKVVTLQRGAGQWIQDVSLLARPTRLTAINRIELYRMLSYPPTRNWREHLRLQP